MILDAFFSSGLDNKVRKVQCHMIRIQISLPSRSSHI